MIWFIFQLISQLSILHLLVRLLVCWTVNLFIHPFCWSSVAFICSCIVVAFDLSVSFFSILAHFFWLFSSFVRFSFDCWFVWLFVLRLIVTRFILFRSYVCLFARFFDYSFVRFSLLSLSSICFIIRSNFLCFDSRCFFYLFVRSIIVTLYFIPCYCVII